MTTCLLCNMTLTPTFKFSDIILSRPPRETVCLDCQSQFELISDRHCQMCYKPDIDGTCHDCLADAEQLPHRAIFHYNDFAKAFFQRYKFQGDFRLRHTFDEVLVKALKEQLVVPIPVSPERLQSRGFNQVTGFLTSAQISYQELLIKTETEHQSHKTRLERLATANPFTVKSNATIPEQVVLFDDIYTTGATLKNAAKTLKNAGCAHVSTFSLFR